MITAMYLDARREVHVVDVPDVTVETLQAKVGGYVIVARPLPDIVLGHSDDRLTAFHQYVEGSPMQDDRPLAEVAPALVVVHRGAEIRSMSALQLIAVAAYLVTAEGFTNPPQLRSV